MRSETEHDKDRERERERGSGALFRQLIHNSKLIAFGALSRLKSPDP